MKIRFPDSSAATLVFSINTSPITYPLYPELPPACFVGRAQEISDTKPEAAIRKTGPVPEAWLYEVQKRINGSIVPQGYEGENDGRWLSQDIADSANGFFDIASDVLPSEPHIYSSRKGDLVAEYEASHGTMTNIISKTQLVMFVVSKGVPDEKRINLKATEAASLRQEILNFTNSIR